MMEGLSLGVWLRADRTLQMNIMPFYIFLDCSSCVRDGSIHTASHLTPVFEEKSIMFKTSQKSRRAHQKFRVGGVGWDFVRKPPGCPFYRSRLGSPGGWSSSCS